MVTKQVLYMMTQNDILDRLHRSLDDDAMQNNEAAAEEGELHFTLPDDYFTSFSDRLSKKLEAGHNDNAIGLKARNPLSAPLRIAMAVASAAAMLVLFFSTSFYFYNEQRAIDAQVESIMAYDDAVDSLIYFVGGQNIEEILADATLYE